MAPRWLVGLLARVVPRDRQDDVIGDLEELHGRRVASWGPGVGTLITVLEGGLILLSQMAAGVLRLFPRATAWISGAEVRLALRLTWKNPVMTLTSVVALGVGIGLVAGAVSVIQQGLFGALPFENGDRWVTLQAYDARTGDRESLDREHLRLLRSSVSGLDYIGGAESGVYNLVHENGEVERVEGAGVTPGLFGHLPYRAVAGRTLLPSDGAPGAEPVALLRESLWVRRFSGDAGVVGRHVDIAGRDYRVVGVLPDDAGFPSGGEIWIALPESGTAAADDGSPVPRRLIGILAEGVTPERAALEASGVSSRLASPGSGNALLRIDVASLARPPVSPQNQVGIGILLAVLLAAFLVIASNVGNLVVARTSRRTVELAVRTALGASRSRLVGQLFVEMLVIGTLASILGLLAAGWLLALYDRVLDELPFWVQLGLRPSTAAIVVALALLATAVTGILPALKATGRHPGDLLRGAGRGGRLGIGRIGGLMIGAEVALSVALLGGAALFARGFQFYVDPPFDLPQERVLTARLDLPLDTADLPEGGAASVGDSLVTLLDRLRESLAAEPWVTGVGVASHLPRTSPFPEPLEIEGSPDPASTPVVAMGAGLLEVLDVEPLLGRAIEARDLEEGAAPVAVVNRAFAARHFGSGIVLGRRVRASTHDVGGEPEPWREIVGVIPDVIEVATPGEAGVYIPLTPRFRVMLAVSVTGEPLSHAGALRRLAYDMDPALNLSEVVRLEDVGSQNRSFLGAMGSALVGLGVITLLLSLAGVYSIVSLAVTQRTREIGVRVALGADRRGILASLLRRSALLVLAGAAVGAVLGYFGTRARLFTFPLPEPAWWFFPALVLLMGAAGVVACWVPARRALAIQPVEALRYDG